MKLFMKFNYCKVKNKLIQDYIQAVNVLKKYAHDDSTDNISINPFPEMYQSSKIIIQILSKNNIIPTITATNNNCIIFKIKTSRIKLDIFGNVYHSYFDQEQNVQVSSCQYTTDHTILQKFIYTCLSL